MSVLDLLRSEPDVREFKRGDAVFHRGDAGDCLYVVIDGAIDILLGQECLERIASGGVFGEMALIDSRPRSATAIAATDVRVAAVSEKRFLRLVALHPGFALEMMRVITERLRRRNDS